MKNKLYKIILILFLCVLFIPSATQAQERPPVNTGGVGNTATATNTGGVGNTPYKGATLTNPLAGGNINDIPTLVETLLRIVLVVGVPLIALAIIYAGFKFVTAQGNPEKLKEAKETFLWVIVGAAILLSAYAIAVGIQSTVIQIRGGV
jgi:hypothetical protein